MRRTRISSALIVLLVASACASGGAGGGGTSVITPGMTFNPADPNTCYTPLSLSGQTVTSLEQMAEACRTAASNASTRTVGERANAWFNAGQALVEIGDRLAAAPATAPNASGRYLDGEGLLSDAIPDQANPYPAMLALARAQKGLGRYSAAQLTLAPLVRQDPRIGESNYLLALRGKLEDGLQAAVIDPLTGLYNRRYALSYVKRMLASAQDAQGTARTCAVLVADLDHFKSVNDTYGHAAGDAVLAQVSARMRAALPFDAMIARIGGEEFLIAVPDTSLRDVRNLADHLRRVVRDTSVPLAGGGGPVRVTVSIGASLATPGPAGPKTDVGKLVAEADKALYGSKTGGRDTVTVCRRPAA